MLLKCSVYPQVKSLKQLLLEFRTWTCRATETGQEQGQDDPDFDEFISKTWIASDQQIHLRPEAGGRGGGKLFSPLVDMYIKLNYRSQDRDLVPREEAVKYLKGRHFERLHVLLNDDDLFSHLLKSGTFFEELGDNCFLQRTGHSAANFVWNRKQITFDDQKQQREASFSWKMYGEIVSEVKEEEAGMGGDGKRKRKQQRGGGRKDSAPHKRLKTSSEPVESRKQVGSKQSAKWGSTGGPGTGIKTGLYSVTASSSQRVNRNALLYSRSSSKGLYSANYSVHGKAKSLANMTSNELFLHIFSETKTQTLFTLTAKQTLQQLLGRAVEQHKGCDFRKLVNSYCPLEAKYYDKYPFSVRVALDQFSTHKSVSCLMRAVLFHVFGIQLFGSKANFQKVYFGLKLLVVSGLNIELRASNIVHGVNYSQCLWLQDPNISAADKRYIFETLTIWVTNYFLDFLKSYFYVTETQRHKNQLFFFRHCLWDKIVSKQMAEMRSEGRIVPLRRGVDVNRRLKPQSLSLSSIRFIPKSSGLRMINKIVASNQQDKKSKKFVLKRLLVVLKALNVPRTGRSPSAEGFNLIIQTLKEKLSQSHSQEGKYFYIRADISNCYSSIDQKKLVEIVDKEMRLLFEGRSPIYIQELQVVTKARDRLVVKRVQFLSSGGDDLLKLVYENIRKLQDCIIVPKLGYRLNQKEVFEQIREYICEATIKTGCKSLYWLRKGLRQGGMLSSELCSLYMNSLKEEYFGDFGETAEEVALVEADDMLFLTPSLERGYCLHVILSGFDSYSFHVNLDKLFINFSFPGISSTSGDEIVFVGRRLDVKSFGVVVDYSSYALQDVRYTFNCNPFLSYPTVTRNLIHQLPLNMAYFDIDEDVNSKETIARNIFERVLLQSLRLSAYLKLSPTWRSKQSAPLLLSFVIGMAHRIYKLGTQWSLRRKVTFSLTEAEVCFISANATLKHWTRSKMSHRKLEIQVLQRLQKRVTGSVDGSNIISWVSLFNEYPKKPFSEIELPYN